MGENALAGLVAGTTSACLFSPVDRALFLAHVNKRPFLAPQNFASPWQGVRQVVLQRVITGGLCFPLEDTVRKALPEAATPSRATHNFVSGTLSGSVLAVVTNPLASITYEKWVRGQQGDMWQVARGMWAKAGVRSFNRAIGVTLARDIVWGGTWSWLRHELPNVLAPGEEERPGLLSFAANLVAAAVATAISSPLNYARNLQFGHCPAAPARPGTLQILRGLQLEANEFAARTGGSRVGFVASRLAIGWGTLRVSVGLAVSSQIYHLSVQGFASDRARSGASVTR